jgi:toll-like receptor 13
VADTKVEEFLIHPQACLLRPETSKLITGVLTVWIVSMTTFILLFRFRWHVRLLLYETFRGKNDGARQRRLANHHFNFDVFVSYDWRESRFVLQRVMPQLEGRLGLRLCIHERDFIPGQNIVDNIAHCVEHSKKIMMVFSKNFVRSQWCQFELAFCLSQVMEYDDALVIVCIDDVTSHEMTPTMMAVLRTTTYIQWVGLGDAARSFWGRLQVALQEAFPQHNGEHQL